MPIIVAACLASVIVITIVLTTYASGIKKDFSTKVRGVVDQVNTTQFYQYELEKKSLDKLNNLVNNVNNIRNNYATKKELTERVVTNVLDVKDVKQHDGTVNIDGKIDFGNGVTVNRTDRSVDTKVINGSAFNIKDAAGNNLLIAKDKIEVPYAKIDRLQLGDKFQLSGVGDAHGNDGWLRLFNKSGSGYNGGMAMDALWVGNGSFLNGTTQVTGILDVKGKAQFKGGNSEYNPQHLPTEFPAGDERNYLRGDTDLLGNNRNMGDLSVGRNLNVNGSTTLKKTRVDSMKVGHNWGGWADESALSVYSKNIGFSSCGEEFCSHFPYIGDTYIRPGKTNGKIILGDIGNTSSIELGDLNTTTNIKGKLCIGDICLTKEDIAKVKAMR